MRRARDVERLECRVEELRELVSLLRREQREYVDAKVKAVKRKVASERKRNCGSPRGKCESTAKQSVLNEIVEDASGDFAVKDKLILSIEKRKEIDFCTNKKEQNELELEHSDNHKVIERNDAISSDAIMTHKVQKNNEATDFNNELKDKQEKYTINPDEFSKQLLQSDQYIVSKAEEVVRSFIDNLKLELNTRFEYAEQRINQVQTEYPLSIIVDCKLKLRMAILCYTNSSK